MGNEQISDLTQLSIRELLALEAAIVSELRARELVRTNNKPLGDIAEQVVLHTRGGSLEPNSTKSHDVTDRDGHKIQVKARSIRPGRKIGRFSPFRSFNFDSAVFLIFDAETFDLVDAREAGPEEIMGITKLSTHTNGRQPNLSQVSRIGESVFSEMKTAYEALNQIPQDGL